MRGLEVIGLSSGLLAPESDRDHASPLAVLVPGVARPGTGLEKDPLKALKLFAERSNKCTKKLAARRSTEGQRLAPISLRARQRKRELYLRRAAPRTRERPSSKATPDHVATGP